VSDTTERCREPENAECLYSLSCNRDGRFAIIARRIRSMMPSGINLCVVHGHRIVRLLVASDYSDFTVFLYILCINTRNKYMYVCNRV